MQQRLITATALLGLGWGSYRIDHMIADEQQDLEPRRHTVQPPPDLDKRFEVVAVTSSDGTHLACWYAPARNHITVLFVHGYAADRLQLYPEARFLQERGFGAMLCDSRAHGESEGASITYGALEGFDLKAVADWLTARSDGAQDQLMGLGFSMGALALLHFAAIDPRLAAVVLEAAPTSLYQFTVDEGGALGALTAPLRLLPLAVKGINPLDLDAEALLAKAKPRPLLFVHGEDDPIVPLKRMRALFAAVAEPKRQIVLPKRGHGFFFVAPDDTYANGILEFFTTAEQRRKGP